MADNAFIDVIVGIGDGFQQILEKLGFKESETEKVIKKMQDENLLEGTNIRGVWTEDGEIKVAQDTGVKNDSGEYVVRFKGPSLDAIKQAILESKDTDEPIDPGDKAPEIKQLINDAKEEAGKDIPDNEENPADNDTQSSVKISVTDGDGDQDTNVIVSNGDVKVNGSDYSYNNRTAAASDFETADEPLSANPEEDAKLRAIAAIPADGHSAPVIDNNGQYTGLFITKDGVTFTPTDTNGDGLNDQQAAFRLEEAIKSIKDGEFGAPLKDLEGHYSGWYVDRQGNKYTPTDINGNVTEDHQEAFANGTATDDQPDSSTAYNTAGSGAGSESSDAGLGYSSSFEGDTDGQAAFTASPAPAASQTPAAPAAPSTYQAIKPKSESQIYGELMDNLENGSLPNAIKPASPGELYNRAIADVKNSGMSATEWAEANESRISEILDSAQQHRESVGLYYDQTGTNDGVPDRATILKVIDEAVSGSSTNNLIRTDNNLGEKLKEYNAEDYQALIDGLTEDIVNQGTDPVQYFNGEEGYQKIKDAAAMYMSNNGLDPSQANLTANNEVIDAVNAQLRDRGYLDNLGSYGNESGDTEDDWSADPAELAENAIEDATDWGTDDSGYDLSDPEQRVLAARDKARANGSHSEVVYNENGEDTGWRSTQDGVTFQPVDNDRNGVEDNLQNHLAVAGMATPAPKYDLADPEQRVWAAMEVAQANGSHSAVIYNERGEDTGWRTTQDGNLFQNADADGNGVEDHVQAYQAQVAANTPGQYGVPLAHNDGTYTGLYIRPDGSTYTPVNADGDDMEDHQEQYLAEHAGLVPVMNGDQQQYASGTPVYYHTSDASMVDPASDNYSGTVASYTTDTTRPIAGDIGAL